MVKPKKQINKDNSYAVVYYGAAIFCEFPLATDNSRLPIEDQNTMSARIISLKLKLPVMLSTGFLLLGCQATVSPEFGMVDWYIANGTGNNMSLNIYDKVCKQSHMRVRVSRSTDTAISTCANSDGRAEIRYQRTGGYSVTENPVRHDVVSANESLHVN